MEEINIAENEKALHEMREKRKKAKKRRKILIPLAIVGVLFLGFVIFIAIVIAQMTKKPKTFVINPTEGELEASLSVAGTVESNQTITYYAPANLQVSTTVEIGAFVNSGDVVLKFDEDDVAYATTVASLQGSINENDYKKSLENINKSRSEYNDAKNKVTQYTQLANEQQAALDQINKEISEAQTGFAYNHQNEIYSRQKKVTQELQPKIDELNQKIAEATKAGDTETVNKLTEELKPITEEATTLTNEAADLQGYANTGGKPSQELLDTQSAVQKSLADYQTELEKAKAIVNQYEATAHSYDRNGVDLNKELADVQAAHNIEGIDKIRDGLKAEFDGVVVNMPINAGDTAVAGSPIATISSLDDVRLKVIINKTDITKIKVGQKATVTVVDNEYEGTVEFISNVASISEKAGAQLTAIIHIDNPDEKLILGIDGKAVIHTAREDKCIMLPVENVYADSKGEFVYAVVDNIVEKRYVTTGISSNKFIQIVDGLTLEDVVVKTINDSIVEGAVVSPVNSTENALNFNVTEDETDDETPVEDTTADDNSASAIDDDKKVAMADFDTTAGAASIWE